MLLYVFLWTWKISEAHGVDPLLALAVAYEESRFYPHARSHAGAIGVFQVMPYVFADYGIMEERAMFEPTVNIFVGIRHLKDYIRRYGLLRGLASYNAGPGNWKAGIKYAEKVLARYQVVRGIYEKEGKGGVFFYFYSLVQKEPWFKRYRCNEM